MWYQNIGSTFCHFVTKHTCDRRTHKRTNGQTERQNYYLQDSASIAATRGKNRKERKMLKSIMNIKPDILFHVDMSSQGFDERDDKLIVRALLCRYKYINIIWFCSNWLAMSNSCYNPFVYGLLNVSLCCTSVTVNVLQNNHRSP